MKKNKVLHISLTLDIGGLETIIAEFCKDIVQRKDFEAEILCLNDINSDFSKELEDFGIPVHVLKKKTKFDFNFFFRVASFIKSRKIDIIHAHSGCFFYAAIFSQLARVQGFLYTAHGMPIFTNMQSRLEDIIAGLFCDNIVAVSHDLEKFLRKWHCIHNTTFSTIINGIDVSKFQPITSIERKNKLLNKYNLPTNRRIIGSVGRLAPEKNYAMLIEAFSHLYEKMGDSIQLVFVGSGIEEEKLTALAREYGIDKNTSFLGIQYNVQEILPLFDVFVLSSLTEGTSISLLEAQACAIPAVVTDVGGNGFIVNEGNNGYLCTVNDALSMADKIYKIIDDPQLANTLSQNARDKVHSLFSISSMVNKYCKLYAQTLCSFVK